MIPSNDLIGQKFLFITCPQEAGLKLLFITQRDALQCLPNQCYIYITVFWIGEDKMCWKLDKKKGFKVGVYYRLLDSDTDTATTDHLFPWKIIWRSKVPLRVAFYVWTVDFGNILTIDNLRKRKVKIIDWCYMCKCNGESVDHLMLHCPIISDLWSMIFSLFGVFWVMPKSVVELLAC